IHGKVRFEEPEWHGFKEAAGSRTNVVGVKIDDADDFRLYREHGSMPVLRGTALVQGDRSADQAELQLVPVCGWNTRDSEIRGRGRRSLDKWADGAERPAAIQALHLTKSNHECTVKTILILEDNDERIAAFQKTVAVLGDDFEPKVWRDAPSMCGECAAYFSNAALISLDHDLNPMPGVTTDPGTGLDVAQFLGDFLPVCPVLIHSSNIDRVYSMQNELRFAGWMVDRVGPIGTDWVETSWLRSVRGLLAEHTNTWKADLPADHTARVERMRLSLDGLGLGDALGEMLSYRAESAPKRLAENNLPSGPWFHTDDTEMAISICAVLKAHGHVHQDALAKRFARRFERDPDRGYGKMTRIQMREINAGAKWRETAANAFSGQGSMGNGGAMRVAPLGAYFADDLERCAEEARASSLVTHTHPEGVAGAIAVAVAAAVAWQLRDTPNVERVPRLFDEVLRLTPESEVRRKI